LCSDSIPKATTKDYHRHMHDLGNAAKCILSHRPNPMTFTRLVEKLSGGIPLAISAWREMRATSSPTTPTHSACL
ncbi:hypothetical protein CLOM_g24297, partial [Closterium sp. NIES-68]